LRVSQIWAGKQWGAFFWPRIGHEVVVIFEEGDPDQPLVAGSVYNADNMPVFGLPANKKIAGIKSATVDSSPKQDYNAIFFYDEKDKEHLSLHSERHLTMHAEYDKRFYTGRHTGEHVPGNKMTRVGRMPSGGSDSGS
jgi:type VI secretion system secreted protein VgrG